VEQDVIDGVLPTDLATVEKVVDMVAMEVDMVVMEEMVIEAV
jgi:hypothetical protein|tara:strand:- start:398 stop:523 length:126 start_codon:yes stop_codon:yes gene_type:complete